MKFNKIWNNIINLKSDLRDITNIKIKEALEEVGNPQNEYKTIHVGGTNGKGSTSNFIYEGLKEKFKTGLFVSPNVMFEMELARVDVVFISKEEFANIYIEHKKIIEKYNLTFFEIKTLISFCWFKTQQVDYAIIEVGLGGLHDATNCLKPEASVITNIGDDHSEYLGEGFESKAIKKLGIQKKGIPLFTSEPNLIKYSKYPEKIILNKYEYHLTQFPKYQQHNYNLAIQVLEYLGLEKNKAIHIIENTKTPPYRFEKIKKNIYFDAAHNSHGISGLVESVSKNNKNIFILSSQNNKKYIEMIDILKKHGEVYLVDFNFNNSIFSFNAKKVSKETNTKFLNSIKELEINENKTYIFTGSFYFLNSIRNEL